MTALNKCIFRKSRVVCSSAGPKISAFVSHCSANFQPILDCFIPNFKLKYEDSDNIKAGRLNAVVFNLHQIKRQAFLGTPGTVICSVSVYYIAVAQTLDDPSGYIPSINGTVCPAVCRTRNYSKEINRFTD